MFCTNCGKQVADNDRFCPNCGASTMKEAEGKSQTMPNEDSENKTGENGSKVCSSDSPNPNNEWCGSYQKNKMIGLVVYKRIYTDITISEGQVTISQKIGRKAPSEIRDKPDRLSGITKKSTFDFWDTLYSFIFLAIAIVCLSFGQFEGAGGASLLAAVCFFTGFGHEVALQFESGASVKVPVQSKTKAEDLINNVVRRSSRTLPIATDKKSTRVVCSSFAALVVLGLLFGIIRIAGGTNSSTEAAIETVRNGYMGGYTDITVDELITDFFTSTGDVSAEDIIWDGGQTDAGETIVETQCTYGENQLTRIQFKMLSEDTFAFNGMEDPALGTESMSIDECIKILNTIFFTTYTDKYSMEDAIDRLNQVSCGSVLCGASANYKGDRENLYQSAFDLEALPATAANYLGLLDASLDGDDVLFGNEDMFTEGNQTSTNMTGALPSWCSGNYYGEDIYSTLSFHGSGTNTFDIFIYRLVAIENCTITSNNEYQISFTGDFDIDVGSVSGTLESYDGKQITLTITESDWDMLPTGTMMEFYYDYQDEYYSAHLQNGCSSDVCGIYVSMDIPANRLFVWENDENIAISIQNWGNLIALGEITPYEMEWVGNVLYFSGYTIGEEEQFSGNYDPSSGVIELHPVADDSVLFAYSVDGLFAKNLQ